jgi:hypothetical protein
MMHLAQNMKAPYVTPKLDIYTKSVDVEVCATGPRSKIARCERQVLLQ